MTYEAILQFWFQEISPSQWWKADPEFDRLITERFSGIHAQANRCECYAWRNTPKGRLAEIIVLDQFSRNIYRNHPLAFASDSMALALAQEAVAAGADIGLAPEEKNFLYMPYMHSESRLVHETALQLFLKNGSQSNYDFELRHKSIIDRFGRYPHRNSILGRHSSAEEIAFLASPGSSF
ncbi:MAG: DUF924 family protein [Arenimonas sp.]